MLQLWIDRFRQFLSELLNPLRDFAQAFHVPGAVLAALLVGNDGQSLAQGGGEPFPGLGGLIHESA